MINALARLMAVTALLLVAPTILMAVAPADDSAVRPLAMVGPDTLTTTDLKIELGIMQNQKSDGAQSTLPEADLVLRRLIQNRLVMQEGYRMGLDEEFTVSNQVLEFVRHKTMTALLDSISYSVPADTENIYEVRRKAVGDYLADLRRTYNVSVDSTLLASLDYGSDDPAMQKYLREDATVLAVAPAGNLTVAGFSRILRFTEYHGLVGKPDAAQKRDKVLREWLAEAVLFHQVKRQDMFDEPRFVLLRERLEQTLVLQEALRLLLVLDFAPTPKEIQACYEANLDQFTPPSRVKMESLKVANHELAMELKQKMEGGAPVKWLKKNVDGVIQGKAPFPTEFFAPEKLGLTAAEVKLGWVPEPYQVPSGWVVAKVSEIEAQVPKPLAQCQGDVLVILKTDQTRDLMINILAKLESATPVTVLPNAEEIVAGVITDFAARNAATAESAPSSSGQEG